MDKLKMEKHHREQELHKQQLEHAAEAAETYRASLPSASAGIEENESSHPAPSHHESAAAAPHTKPVGDLRQGSHPGARRQP